MVKEKRPTLDELAILHVTDKATVYPSTSVHGYAPIYDQILTPLRDKPVRMLEIGICMECSTGGHSIRMWRDYFTKAQIYTFDIIDMSWVAKAEEFQNRVHFCQGDQGDRNSLNNMYKTFGDLPFDFIVEDGSHMAHHQMISLGHLFQYVKSGGYYMLEDVSIPGHPDVCCLRNDENFKVLQNFKETGEITSGYLLPEEKEYLEKNIKNIEIYPDCQNAYSVAILTKK